MWYESSIGGMLLYFYMVICTVYVTIVGVIRLGDKVVRVVEDAQKYRALKKDGRIVDSESAKDS